MEEGPTEQTQLKNSLFSQNSINSIIDRIDFGRFHFKTPFALCILIFLDGAELSLLTILSFTL